MELDPFMWETFPKKRDLVLDLKLARIKGFDATAFSKAKHETRVNLCDLLRTAKCCDLKVWQSLCKAVTLQHKNIVWIKIHVFLHEMNEPVCLYYVSVLDAFFLISYPFTRDFFDTFSELSVDEDDLNIKYLFFNCRGETLRFNVNRYLCHHESIEKEFRLVD